MAADPTPAIVPGRFRRPLIHVVDEAVSEDVIRQAGECFHTHAAALQPFGDPAGELACGWELPDLDALAPEVVTCVMMAVFAVPAATMLEALAVPEFNVAGLDMTARLFHHGGHCGWHDGAEDANGDLAVTRRIGFELFLHTQPRMFRGGELDFLAGDSVEPVLGRLVLRHPLQVQRVRRVECLSAEALHGRWSIAGWVHGDPPDGWVERVEALRVRLRGT